MHTPAVWTWALVILGLSAMLGAIDPLEGSFVILPGAALVAGGAGSLEVGTAGCYSYRLC